MRTDPAAIGAVDRRPARRSRRGRGLLGPPRSRRSRRSVFPATDAFVADGLDWDELGALLEPLVGGPVPGASTSSASTPRRICDGAVGRRVVELLGGDARLIRLRLARTVPPAPAAQPPREGGQRRKSSGRPASGTIGLRPLRFVGDLELAADDRAAVGDVEDRLRVLAVAVGRGEDPDQLADLDLEAGLLADLAGDRLGACPRRTRRSRRACSTAPGAAPRRGAGRGTSCRRARSRPAPSATGSRSGRSRKLGQVGAVGIGTVGRAHLELGRAARAVAEVHGAGTYNPDSPGAAPVSSATGEPRQGVLRHRLERGGELLVADPGAVGQRRGQPGDEPRPLAAR